MKFIQHSSGSKGNLYEVVSGSGDRLIIDPGVSWDNMRKALESNLKGIVGCVISHEHNDHCKAVSKAVENGLDIYASYGTLSALGLSVDHYRVNVLRTIKPEMIGSFRVDSFPANHDAEQPLLFRISVDGESMLYATDTAYIKQKFSDAFGIVAIECSYDEHLLKHLVKGSKINEQLAKRLLDTHYSKTNCMAYLQDSVDLSQCREIHLIHLSGSNIEKEQTAKEFQNKLFVRTLIKN